MRNELYPVFLRLDRLRILIVGGGYVGMEKLHFLTKSSPQAHLTVLAPEIKVEIVELQGKVKNLQLIQEAFAPSYLPDYDIVIAATNLPDLNREVHREAKALGKIVNVADTPALCDFYMGSIVTRGNLKVAISTNGKSPTFAKRFRQLLEDILPEDVDELINSLKEIRDGLEMDFEEKVDYLNELTKSLIEEKK